MPFPNSDGRPKGSPNKHSLADINARLGRMEGLLQSIAKGDCRPINNIEDALGAIEFLNEECGNRGRRAR